VNPNQRDITSRGPGRGQEPLVFPLGQEDIGEHRHLIAMQCTELARLSEGLEAFSNRRS